MFYALFSLLIAFAAADPTGPPKARRSAGVIAYYTCPSHDAEYVYINAIAILDISPPLIGCEYGDGTQCQYNYITGEISSGSPECLAAIGAIPQPGCTSFGCAPVPSYTLASITPGTYFGISDYECTYNSDNPSVASFACTYFTSNGQLAAASGEEALSCPVPALCTSIGPSRRQTPQQPERRTINEKVRASKADEFEDEYQPW
ncbi:hypothetical protein CALVIDRAFT_600011 [Calocera viscosa TUFC12733]|uniref:Uncharacterized protein n=1 Tax=Calocera viscosa (strain TUFC12733) TaxID=1330018 RepID=A0A167K7T1_CALVF|nr:hypothetical protein CALVIDRAFT_600011 [Calocera viscosa TUFC12733]